LGRDVSSYLDYFRFHRAGSIPLAFETTVAEGCPHDCGLCPEHEQHVCMPIVEITDHCDLHCPICLVRNRSSYHMTVSQMERLLDQLIESEGQIDVLNISGGEPTLHPDFESMVEVCLRRKEILRVSVSTNGVRLAADEALAKFLAERDVIVSLQYDGEDDAVYGELRGRPLAETKRAILERSFHLDAPLSITATVVRNLNESQLPHIADLVFGHENILSLMVQPAAFVGRGATFRHGQNRRITIPEVIALIAQASVKGVDIQVSDFSPLPCSHPACFSLAFFLKVGPGEYLSVKRLVEIDRYLDIIENRGLFGVDAESFEKVRSAVYELWSGPAGTAPDSERALKAVRELLRKISCCGGFDGRTALKTAERSIKSVFVHHFMDADTFDLSRARKCCNVYPLADGRFVPACVHNVLRRER